MLSRINLNGREIGYTVRTSRRSKNLRVTVYGDGRLLLSRPAWVSQRRAESFLREKADWLIGRIEHFLKNPSPLAAGGKREEYLARREEARRLVHDRLAHFNEIYKLKFNRVSIRNQKTRWGSCSRRGNLNFSYRLINLSPEAADYVIVHELCHLAEFNHSPRFWNLVARAVPDYVERRKSLRLG